jgi:hypothetical protein
VPVPPPTSAAVVQGASPAAVPAADTAPPIDDVHLPVALDRSINTVWVTDGGVIYTSPNSQVWPPTIRPDGPAADDARSDWRTQLQWPSTLVQDRQDIYDPLRID